MAIMKTAIFLALVVSCSASILSWPKDQAQYEGAINDYITEDAAFALCKAMNAHLESKKDGFQEQFFEVPLPQTNAHGLIWFKRGLRQTAIASLMYNTGCYRWEMRPCYGYYPNSFTHPCTFWIPTAYPDGSCVFDYGPEDKYLMAQKSVTIDGRSAAQLCSSTNEALNKRKFSMAFIPLKLNLRSVARCETWSYFPEDDDPMNGKWDVEEMPEQECDEKYPDFDVEEMEDPEIAGVECIPSLNGEYECFFNDDNMPVQKQIEIQNMPSSLGRYSDSR